MRVPRAGGTVRVFDYPKEDSVLWTSSNGAPAIDRVLAFDPDGGTIAFVDTRGVPGRLELRTGSVSLATTAKAKLSGLTSIDGSTIYGIGADGALARFTLSGDWVYKPPRPARAVYPQRDGSVLLQEARGPLESIWRLHPPDDRIIDSARVPAAGRVLRTQLGDRLYLVQDRSLVGVRTRTLQPLPTITFESPVVALTATPSGDRLFVATESNHQVSVVDRYQDRVAAAIPLPGQPQDFRIDGLGRFLLVRAARGDSAWVVAIGTDSLVGTVRSAWRHDLPVVMPDGAIALAQGADVVFVDGETLKPRQRAHGGASDFWYGFLWDGFRPRAKTLDQPAQFQSDSIDSVRAAASRDSAAIRDSSTSRSLGMPAANPAAPASATQPNRPLGAPAVHRDSTAVKGFSVSFAALLSESAARQLATQIRVRNETPHVVTTTRNGATVYRVVMGPYPTREAAEGVGRESGHTYWVYENNP